MYPGEDLLYIYMVYYEELGVVGVLFKYPSIFLYFKKRNKYP
jgi:hypothetical protein